MAFYWIYPYPMTSCFIGAIYWICPYRMAYCGYLLYLSISHDMLLYCGILLYLSISHDMLLYCGILLDLSISHDMLLYCGFLLDLSISHDMYIRHSVLIHNSITQLSENKSTWIANRFHRTSSVNLKKMTFAQRTCILESATMSHTTDLMMIRIQKNILHIPLFHHLTLDNGKWVIPAIWWWW